MNPFIFKYDKGNLFVICKNDGRFELKETMYVHLQKRQMNLNKNILNKDKYYIVPDSFLPVYEDINIYFTDYPDLNKLSYREYKVECKINEKISRKYIINRLNRKRTEYIKKKRYKKLGYHEEDFEGVSIRQYAEGVMRDFYERGGVLLIVNNVYEEEKCLITVERKNHYGYYFPIMCLE